MTERKILISKLLFSQIYLKPIIIFLLMVFTLQFLLLLSLHYFVLNYINTIIINCSQLQLGFYLSVPFLNGLTVHLMVFITPKTLGLLLALSTSVLIALFIQHLSEISIKEYTFVAIPVFIYGFIFIALSERSVKWMFVALILIIVLFIFIKYKSLLTRTSMMVLLVVLFLAQQVLMTNDSRKITIEPYQTTIKTINDSNYRSPVLNKKLSICIKALQIH